MKNNKKIITEVSRLQELMGVKKELINEQAKPIVLAVKSLKKLVQQSSKTVSAKTALLKRINKLTDDLQSPAQKVTAIKYILKNGDEQMVKVINKLIKDQSENTIKLLNKTIDDNRPMIKNWIEDGLTKKQIIKLIVDDGPIIKTGDDAVDLIIKKNMRENIGKAYDEIKGPIASDQGSTVRKKITKSKVDDVADEVDADIPPNNTKTLDDGSEVSDLFNTNTWKDDIIKLTDDEIAALANPKWLDSITDSFTSIFKSTNEQVSRIQKIAQAIEKTTDSKLKTKLTTRLKKEMENLYKKNTNQFVALRQYFDDISKIDTDFRKTWYLLKGSNGGWDFYKTFGNLAQHNSRWRALWAGLTNDLKVIFEAEKKFFSKIASKATKKVSTSKSELIGSIGKNIMTGSRKGLPYMSNKLYKEIIEKYGPKAAKVSYVRDLVLNLLKWNVYIGLFSTIRNSIANYAYEDNIQDCINSGDKGSKECLDLSDDYMSRMMAEWSLQYREDPTKAANFFAAWANQINPFSSANLPDLSSDIDYRDYTEIAKLDPGYVGNILNTITKFISINDDPAIKNSTLEALDLAISEVQVEKDKIEDKIEEEIKNEEITPEVTPEVTPVPNTVSGTIEDAAKQLGVTVEQVTQDGDIFIWSIDGQEIGRYKMINGKLKIQ